MKSFSYICIIMDNVTTQKAYSILALDDHPVVLEGLNHLLTDNRSDIVYDGVTTSVALHNLLEQGHHYDLFILDLELPDGDGFAEIAHIRSYCPGCAILIYTMHEEPWVVARLAKLDIQGIVSKSSSVGQIAEAVEIIRGGGNFYNEAFLRKMSDNISAMQTDAVELSHRERQVLQGICQGKTTQEMADGFFLSANTIGTYRRRLMSKFGVHNVAQLIAKAQQLLPPFGSKNFPD